MTVTLYGKEKCIPCEALKKKFRRRGIEYVHIDITTCNEDERRRICTEVCRVTGYDKATVPAVCVEVGGRERWFSNFGKVDITRMFTDVCTYLGK